MKVDRNQNCVPSLEMVHNHPADGRLTHVIPEYGGIPLRLHIAAQSFPMRWSTEAIQALANGAGCTIPEAVRKAADCELNIADALIAAHNETCDREGDL